MEAGEIAAGPRVRRARERGASLDEIAAVYTRDAARLRRVAAGIIGDADAAHDVVQETFARVVRKRGSFGRTGPLEAWVWRVCVNTALNRRRAAETELRASASFEPAAPAEPVDEAVRATVAALPPRQRAALFLHYYADLDYESVAAVLRIRPGTVGKLLHDGRAAIRRALEEGEWHRTS